MARLCGRTRLPDPAVQPADHRYVDLLREAALRVAEWPDGPQDAQALRIAKVLVDEIRASPVEAFGVPMPADPRAQRIAARLIAEPSDARGLDAWRRRRR